MERSGPIGAIALAAVAALLVYAVVNLVALRYESGDAYPPYSSYRSDSLGTRALYESLERLPDLEVRRHRGSPQTLARGQEDTVLIAGTADMLWDGGSLSYVEALEQVMTDGGRVVVTYAPEGNARDFYRIPGEDVDDDEEDEEESEAVMEVEEDAATEEDEEDAAPEEDEKENPKLEMMLEHMRKQFVQVSDRWGVAFAFDSLEPDEDGVYLPETAATTQAGLPSAITWRSALYFEPTSTAWNTIYTRDDQAVIVERSFGAGSLVLCGDSYLLSNEALRENRQTDLIAWLIQPRGAVVFDETIHGLAARQGLMVLARRYRLHGVMIGFVLLALLYVWKTATPFVPRYEDEVADVEVLDGRDGASGLTNLMRRSIEPSDVVSVCVDEWSRSCGETGPAATPAERLDRMKAAARVQDPVQAYRAIAALVKERTHRS